MENAQNTLKRKYYLTTDNDGKKTIDLKKTRVNADNDYAIINVKY